MWADQLDMIHDLRQHIYGSEKVLVELDKNDVQISTLIYILQVRHEKQ